jgi:hypothetical protein
MRKEFTATVYIIEDQKVLLIYHRKLQNWFTLEQLKQLEPDVEIFNETLQVLACLFQQLGSTSECTILY